MVLIMEDEDLQSLIQRRMRGQKYGWRPLSKEESEGIMYEIGLGVLWLHENDVVHRVLKAANVLTSKGRGREVADYECSIGVIGTRYWRAPEILHASKEKTVSQKPELFSKAADVYSYAMTCYELLSGKLPFEGEMVTIESVIEGQRPTVPSYVDDWIKQLLHRCWDYTSERPVIQEILSIIASNTCEQGIKDDDEVRVETKITDVEELHLGCDNLLHSATRLESGNLKCLLCFETRNDSSMIKCTTCIDHYLHSRCAFIRNYFHSSIHPHLLSMESLYWRGSSRLVCDGCQLEIGKESWYHCPVLKCDYDLHVECAKYVGSISHPLHKEHKLVLSSRSLISTSLQDLCITCECCKLQIKSMEFIYHCEECVFNIHPKCAVPNLKVHRIKVSRDHII